MKTIQSDTLYAALTSCLAKVGSEIPSDGDLGFTISSMFPYYQEKSDCAPIFFLPMPFQTYMPQLTDVSKAKSIKKIQWIDSTLFSSVSQGKALFDGTDKYFNYIYGYYLTAEPFSVENDEFIQSEVAQRVVLESRTGAKDALPYYIDRITFRDNSGLYFIATGKLNILDEALTLLSSEGLGTDRNVGFGSFEYTKDTLTIDTPDDSDFQMALSLFIPESEEQLHELLASDYVAYDIVRRGGWITTYPYTTYRKNAIYGFLPGSVFCRVGNSEIKGKIVNLSPNIEVKPCIHPIWRNGKSLMLPIKLR